MTAQVEALALASLDDAGAAAVLGDLVLETRWFDMRVMPLLNRAQYARAADSARRKAHFRLAAKGARAWARAVAAVVLFGEWPDTYRLVDMHWPIMERCYVDRGLGAWLVPGGMTITDIDASAGVITFGGPPPTFFNINRESDPVRLAGLRMDASATHQSLVGLARRLRR